MSSLGFLTRDAEARVSDRERQKLVGLLDDLAWRAIERDCDPREENGFSLLRQALTLPGWVAGHTGTEFTRMLQLVLHGSQGQVRTPTGMVGSVLDVHVATVITLYPDLVTLAVRLACQAEVNGWIDGPDRAWLADLIDKGRQADYPPEVASTYTAGVPLFADEPSVNGHYDGWAGVAAMLRADDKQPVVLESSVTGGFPSQIWAGQEGQDRGEFRAWWNNATPEQRWAASVRGLREETETASPALRIAPGTLHDTNGFGTGVTWAQVAEAWRAPVPQQQAPR